MERLTQWQVGASPYYPVQKPPYSIESPGYQPVEGETIPRRNPKSRDGLIMKPASDVNTLVDIVHRGARLYTNRPAIGWRSFIQMHTEIKKVPKIVNGQKTEIDKEWQYFELSPYSWITYKEYDTYVAQVGSGLRKIGLSAGDMVHVFATSGRNWIAMAHGCASQSMTIVTAYDTLGASGVEHSLLQTKAVAMYVDPHLIKTAIEPLSKISSVKHIIYNDQCIFPADNAVEELKSSRPDLNIISFEELRALGESNPTPEVPPSPSDTFCVMYTSGSTGPPKGAVINHATLVAAIAGLLGCVEESASCNEVLLCYLPAAHIFELALENLALFLGASVGYGNPRTISDSSTKNCPGDIRALRPTALVGVPQVWETIKKGVQAKVAESSPIARTLFWTALSYKSFMISHRLPLAQVFDGIVFSKVRQLTGGRIRFLMNGASGIADGTRHFLNMVVAPMICGYGLTETCACGALGSPVQFTSSGLGPIPVSIEVKLVSLPEMNYLSTNQPPQGEVYIKGGAVMSHYFENAEETSKAMTPDGWFKTGDIGEFDAVGHLRIIDRAKNLIKLQGGEYIALEKLETIYRSSHLVHNVMVDGHANSPRPIVLVMPNEKALAEKAQELGVDKHDMHTSPKVRAAVLKDLQAVAKAGGLSPLETVSSCIITDEEWTSANNLLTATQKLNRRALRDRYKQEFNACLGAA